MNPLPLGMLLPILAATAHAQSATVSLAAATTIVASATLNAVPSQASTPAGPLANVGEVFTWQSLGLAYVASRVTWNAHSFPSVARATFLHDLDTLFTPQSNLSASSEFVVSFTATSSAPAYLEIHATSGLTIGAPQPQVAVDINNDGFVDYPSIANGPVVYVLPAQPLGAAPVVVRVIISSQVAGPGYSSTVVEVAARPDNAVSVVQNALPCGGGQMLPPLPVFANRGVDLTLWPALGVPAVFVLGVNQLPLLLPPYQGLTCLLIPSPDIVLWQPNNALHVPLPVAVRPLTFYVQGVAVTPSALAVTEGYTIAAF